MVNKEEEQFFLVTCVFVSSALFLTSPDNHIHSFRIMSTKDDVKSKTGSTSNPSQMELSKVFIGTGTKITEKRDAKDCPIDRVTVYSDRAEVGRRVTLNAETSGQYEIIISNLCSSVMKDSARVSETSKNVIVLEVMFEEKYEQDAALQSVAAAEIEEKEKQLQKLEYSAKQLRAKTHRLDKEEAWLKNYSEKYIELDNVKGFSLDETAKVMSFYRTEFDKIRAARFAIEKKLKDIAEEMTLLKSEIQRRKAPTEQGKDKSRPQVKVTLFVPSKGQVSLIVSYVVSGAQWQPSYDIRIQTKEQSAQLFYYATVVNQTTEDWRDVHLSLSTASPSLDARPPPLHTLRVKFAPSYIYRPRKVTSNTSQLSKNNSASAYGRSKMSKEDRNVKADSESKRDDATFEGEDSVERTSLDETGAVGMLTADIEQSSTSQMYMIPRTCTIESDNKPHKVTVTAITLQTKFVHIVIPRLVQQAYLRTQMTNTSEYLLVPGPLNVFSDNFFIATTELGTTPPGAEFDIFLGVDPGIKIEIRPVKTKEGKSGMIRKVKTETTAYKTIITNSKQSYITLLVFEQLPYSEDTDKVKVKVIEPELKDNPHVTINEFNNLRWKLSMAPQTKEELKFEYQIEHSPDKELTFVEGNKVDTLE